MDVLERDQDALVGWNIHAGNTGHGLLSCRQSLVERLFLAISGRCPQTRTRRPSPWVSRGPASSENYPTWIRGLLKDSTSFRQPSLCFSSLFRDLFSNLPGLPGSSGLGTRGNLAGRRFCPFGGRFPGLPGGLGVLPGGSGGSRCGFGCFSDSRFGSRFGALLGTLCGSPRRPPPWCLRPP